MVGEWQRIDLDDYNENKDPVEELIEFLAWYDSPAAVRALGKDLHRMPAYIRMEALRKVSGKDHSGDTGTGCPVDCYRIIDHKVTP